LRALQAVMLSAVDSAIRGDLLDQDARRLPALSGAVSSPDSGSTLAPGPRIVLRQDLIDGRRRPETSQLCNRAVFTLYGSAHAEAKSGLGGKWRITMALDLVRLRAEELRKAVMAFLGQTAKSSSHRSRLRPARLTRANVLASPAGKNMDGFVALMVDIVRANGLAHAQIHQRRAGGDFARLLQTDQAMGSSRHPQGRADRGHRAEEPGRAFVRQQLQQPNRRGHRHRTRSCGRRTAKKRLWQTATSVCGLADDGRGCSSLSDRRCKDKSPHFPVFAKTSRGRLTSNDTTCAVPEA
jgi:hypothetical protein